MPERIDYHAMDDHDLLVMSVMQGNECVRHLEIVNNHLKDHENRLIIVELKNGITKPVNLSRKQAISLASAMIIIGGFIAGIVERLL